MAIKRTRESEEMYLETILLLHKGQPNVRAVDVHDELPELESPEILFIIVLDVPHRLHP